MKRERLSKKPQEKQAEPLKSPSLYVAARDKTLVAPRYHLEPLPLSGKRSSSDQTFTFQTFIPDRFVPGTGGLGYGDNRGFGNAGDHYRTFQQIVVQPDEKLNKEGTVQPAAAKVGLSETAITAISGHASTTSLHMWAKRTDANLVSIEFHASIKSGAKFFGQLLESIDFLGAIVISCVDGKLRYFFGVNHDAFPAYEAFLNGHPIYRWSYSAAATVDDLKGAATAVKATRKKGDAPGGVIGPRAKIPPLQEFRRKGHPKGHPYKVKPGDTLSKIALENLGNASRANEIYDDNRDIIGDETHLLRPGITILVHKPVDVHNLAEAMIAATDPQGGLMRIKGGALEYIRRHQTTKEFRLDFEDNLKKQVREYIKSGPPAKSFDGKFKKKEASSYGGDLKMSDVSNWATLGTFLLGHCHPEVRYTVSLSRDPKTGWTAAWTGVWVINDNLDLVGGSDKSSLYNKVADAATLAWHDVVGGRKKADIQAKWGDSGTLIILPEEKPDPISPLFAGVKELEMSRQGKLAIGLGASGEFASRIQFALLVDDPKALPKFGADGHFGVETQAAVAGYQKKHRVGLSRGEKTVLAADGIVGGETLGRMNSLLFTWNPKAAVSVRPAALMTIGTYGVTPTQQQPGDAQKAFLNYHKEGIMFPFALSGGTGTGFDFTKPKSWEKFKLREEVSNPKVAAKNATETNDFSTFYVNEGITEKNFVNLMLGRFVSGVGPENFVFPLNGKVSNEMRHAAIVENALNRWYRENYQAVLSRAVFETPPALAQFGVLEQAGALITNWGILNVPQFVGSATVKVEFLVSDDLETRDDQLLVTIRNVTSATSGDILKHFPFFGTAPSFPRDPSQRGPQNYTNISQTFRFTMAVDRKKAGIFKDMSKAVFKIK